MMKHRRHGGFTLLEIMLVVTIIAILLGTAIYKLRGNVEVAGAVAGRGSIESIKMQLQLYQTLNGFLPSTDQGLRALVTKPDSDPQPQRWTQFLSAVPKDPYGSDYIYLNPGRKNPNSYDLYSPGPDRRPDTADDEWGGQ